jgi:hypothetical protein
MTTKNRMKKVVVVFIVGRLEVESWKFGSGDVGKYGSLKVEWTIYDLRGFAPFTLLDTRCLNLDTVSRFLGSQISLLRSNF